MKNIRILSKVISLVLCIFVLLGSVTTAYGSTDVDMYSYENYTESTSFGNLLTNFIFSVFSNEKTQIQSKGSTLEVRPPFIIAPLHSEASIFSSIVSWVLVYTNVTVEGYDGNYIKVKVNKTDERGYIHKILLTTDKSYLVQQFSNVYVGKSKKILKDYNNPEDFSWSVSQDGIISLNRQTGEIKGLKPGTVTITAKYSGKTDKCIVSSINQWKETESSSATKDIVVKSNPDSSDYGNFTKGTIPSGATIIARGDMADGSGWIYVNSNDLWGFIKLSDFPRIDYLLTEYHYYDKGYKTRFPNVNNNTPPENIYNYTSILNDVMMKLFKLKVCSYVNEYTSLADTCKALSYGEVNKNNISKPCPKNKSHNINSCLERGVLWEQFKIDVGYGNNTTIKLLWTGHILPNHQVSAAQNGSESIVMTTANTVSYNQNTGTYSNKPDFEIRRYSLYTLTHETGHLLGTKDGYCKEDNPNGHCSNENCYSCNGVPIPVCIMVQPFSPEESNIVFCDECTKAIKQHLNDHH